MRDKLPPAWLRERCDMLRLRGVARLQSAWGVAAPLGSRGLRTIKDAGRKTLERLRTMPWQTMASRHWKPLLGIVTVILCLAIWKVPQWQAAGWQGQMEPKDLAKLQNDARMTLVQAFGGAFLLIGLYFTLRNLQLTEDRQITERYTRAVEQLGSDKLEVRLGAIYALERIARDSERDHWPIMEILTAYVREHASIREASPNETALSSLQRPFSTPTADIQAILKVLGRRTRTYGKGEDQPLNLGYTDLRMADLISAHLEKAFLRESRLDGAYLIESHLEGVDLRHAHLEEATLWEARLEGADLAHARLQGADFTDAHLEAAVFTDAYLSGTNFRGAYLNGAIDLTVEQLAGVHTLYEAQLDPFLLEHIQRVCPHLLEEPQNYAESRKPLGP